MEITLKEIEKNLLTLPDNLWGQVNDFVIFLKQKYSDDLPQWQKDELKKKNILFLKTPVQLLKRLKLKDSVNYGKSNRQRRIVQHRFEIFQRFANYW